MSAGHGPSAESDDALATLCRTCWYPLYAYARRQGHPPDDAADLTQGFFAVLLEKDWLQSADPRRGRFRTFLLTAFKRFLAKERDKLRAQKRGGDRTTFSIDVETGERRYRFEPTDDWTAERLYERRWALTILDQVMERLGQEYAARGKSHMFASLKPYLIGLEQPGTYASLARTLDISEPALRVAVHRMRARYRELLKDEVGQTLQRPEEVEDELRYLRSAVRREKSGISCNNSERNRK